jgi:hypothetical protein
VCSDDHDEPVKPAAVVRLGGLAALAALAGACQLAFGLGDYAGATGNAGGGVSGAAGYGSGGDGAGGATTVTSTTSSTSSSAGGGTGTAPPPDGSCECVTTPPAGWSFVHVFTSPKEKGPYADCGDGTPPKVYLSGAPAEPHECSQCSCAAPTAANCPTPKLLCGGGAECAAVKEVGVGGGCALVAVDGSCRLSEAPGKVGTCAPAGGEVTRRPDWTKVLSVCPAVPKVEPSCGGSCLPSVPDGVTCITRPSSTPCNVPGFTRPVEAYATSVDTRACDACTCTPDFTCIGGSYVLHQYNTGICFGDSWSIKTPDCTPVSGAFGAERSDATPSGTCTIGGGGLQGTLKGEDGVAVCCP